MHNPPDEHKSDQIPTGSKVSGNRAMSTSLLQVLCSCAVYVPSFASVMIKKLGMVGLLVMGGIVVKGDFASMS